MTDRRVIFATLLCFGAGIATVTLVASGHGRWPSLMVYLLALACAVAAVWYGSESKPHWEHRAGHPLTRADILPVAVLAGLQLAALIYMLRFPFHYVQDEFITGYTSYTLPGFTDIEWFAGYPGPGEWIAGFPILYYALQWTFIEAFGLSLETIRISTWPYHLLSAALVYLIGREMFRDRLWAVAGGIVYILLAPNLYMAGYGMHNISSTFFFLGAFYAAIRMFHRDSPGWAIAAGLVSAAAYLTYPSSYLTIPLLAVLAGLWAWREWSRRPLRRLAQVFGIAFVGLLPFLTHAVTQENYFTERGDQVNAVSTFYEDETLASPTRELLDHIWTNIQALYTPGIGGVTDYWFGHQALFDWLTLGLLLGGVGLALYRGIKGVGILELAAVAGVVSTFLFGMFLTLPAGGFHRTTLAFPFVALLIVLAMRELVAHVPERTRYAPGRLVSISVGVALVALINLSSLHTMVSEDEEISGLTDSVPITGYIEDQVPENSEIIISAFPHYHLERELIVRTGDAYDVRIEAFETVVDAGADTHIVLFQPSSDQIHRLEARFNGGTFVERHDGQDLERHVIWVPPNGPAQ